MAKVSYSKDGGVGVIRMDDGKANAQNPEFFKEMIAALGQAEKDQVRSLLLLAGRAAYQTPASRARL